MMVISIQALAQITGRPSKILKRSLGPTSRIATQRDSPVADRAYDLALLPEGAKLSVARIYRPVAFYVMAAAVTAGIAGTFASQPGDSIGEGTVTPATGAAATVALRVAQIEAMTTIPGAVPVTGLPATTVTPDWPGNVQSVLAATSTRDVASQFIDGSTVSDTTSVVIVRMCGQFSLAITAPSGDPGTATGTVLSVVADATTGVPLDVGLDRNSACSLPGSALLFARP